MLAAAYRLAGDTQLNQRYGSRERQRYDLFRAADADAPLAVYIHGGYWQRGDRKDYSFVARELNAPGITVAIPSYTLCPAVSVMEIGDEIQQCLAALVEADQEAPNRHRPFGRRPPDGGDAGAALGRLCRRAGRPRACGLRHQRRVRPGTADRHVPQRGARPQGGIAARCEPAFRPPPAQGAQVDRRGWRR